MSIHAPYLSHAITATLRVPGDKSVSHRALMFSALSHQNSEITGLLESADVMATANCLRQLGADIKPSANGIWRVSGCFPLQEASDILDAQNSGTTIRLMSGLLSGQNAYSVLTGDASLRKRPMARVMAPLTQMGAQIYGRQNNRLAPITILPAPQKLQGIHYVSPVASAQVKSAILLAGLFAEGETRVQEPEISRDHTERMLKALGVQISSNPQTRTVTLHQGLSGPLPAQAWQVPTDISSAAFHLVAAVLLPQATLRLEQVGLNPLRTGIISVLQRMGAKISLENVHSPSGEPIGDIVIESGLLHGDVVIEREEVPTLIDEIPIIAIAGLYLEGTLTVRGAEELRAKESDRIEAIAKGFALLGIEMETRPDGFILKGDPGRMLKAPQSPIGTYHDHRIAMAFTVLNHISCAREARLFARWSFSDRDCVNISYPSFFKHLATTLQLPEGAIL